MPRTTLILLHIPVLLDKSLVRKRKSQLFKSLISPKAMLTIYVYSGNWVPTGCMCSSSLDISGAYRAKESRLYESAYIYIGTQPGDTTTAMFRKF